MEFLQQIYRLAISYRLAEFTVADDGVVGLGILQ
jgi:hypothetical protein